jgi:molybdate transport system permease protein
VSGARWFRVLLAGALGLAVAFLTLPVLAIFLDTGPAALARRLGEPVAREALWLSLETTLLALLVIVAVGMPAAYGLATRSFRGRSLLVTLLELPLVMPPAVAGIALLATFGPQGLLGGLVEATGARLVFETAGVVVALTFVSAPFFVRQAQSSFEALDPSWLEASRTLGASEAATFLRVAVPSAGPGLLSGMALAWGRALGEFGATLIFAGSFAGVTQTAPLAIYELFATDLPAALALSAVLVAASAGLLLAVKLVAGRRTVPGAWG